LGKGQGRRRGETKRVKQGTGGKTHQLNPRNHHFARWSDRNKEFLEVEKSKKGAGKAKEVAVGVDVEECGK